MIRESADGWCMKHEQALSLLMLMPGCALIAALVFVPAILRPTILAWSDFRLVVAGVWPFSTTPVKGGVKIDHGGGEKLDHSLGS